MFDRRFNEVLSHYERRGRRVHRWIPEAANRPDITFQIRMRIDRKEFRDGIEAL